MAWTVVALLWLIAFARSGQSVDAAIALGYFVIGPLAYVVGSP
jgi:hypothetical protein